MAPVRCTRQELNGPSALQSPYHAGCKGALNGPSEAGYDSKIMSLKTREHELSLTTPDWKLIVIRARGVAGLALVLPMQTFLEAFLQAHAAKQLVARRERVVALLYTCTIASKQYQFDAVGCWPAVAAAVAAPSHGLLCRRRRLARARGEVAPGLVGAWRLAWLAPE